ncbi:MAG: hypothetical protein WC788_03285 [Candidatus Paceibacterota bacterium]|jgi:hypothetical protein
MKIKRAVKQIFIIRKLLKTGFKVSAIAVFAFISCIYTSVNAQDLEFLGVASADIIVANSDIGESASSTFITEDIVATNDISESASSTFIIPQDDKHISIGLDPDSSSIQSPIIMAKWEANSDRFTDADAAAGAQFMPSGRYGINKSIAFCAIVENSDAAGAVYADVYYPVGVALGSSYTSLQGRSGLGCGKIMQEQGLLRINKESGIELFCNKIRNTNNNLPSFGAGYDYGIACNNEGSLMKETAAVYCGLRDISYGDPSGDYIVRTVADQPNGTSSTIEDMFTYFPVTAFETDFDSIDYGKVKLNSKKVISGDAIFDITTINKPTVRNVGNTRLTMRIVEDDIGLGKTYEDWNVRFDARVGNVSAFTIFEPNTPTLLNDSLGLLDTENIDFSVNIFRFPESVRERLGGSMMLSAEAAPHLACE